MLSLLEDHFSEAEAILLLTLKTDTVQLRYFETHLRVNKRANEAGKFAQAYKPRIQEFCNLSLFGAKDKGLGMPVPRQLSSRTITCSLWCKYAVGSSTLRSAADQCLVDQVCELTAPKPVHTATGRWCLLTQQHSGLRVLHTPNQQTTRPAMAQQDSGQTQPFCPQLSSAVAC